MKYLSLNRFTRQHIRSSASGEIPSNFSSDRTTSQLKHELALLSIRRYRLISSQGELYRRPLGMDNRLTV